MDPVKVWPVYDDHSGMSLTQHRSALVVEQKPFQVVTELDGDVTVVSVAGELDLATVADVRSALIGATNAGVTRLVVDLSDVSFIDSVGVGAILHAKRRMTAGGVIAVVVTPSSYARVIFEVVGADAFLSVFETRAAAVTHAVG